MRTSSFCYFRPFLQFQDHCVVRTSRPGVMRRPLLCILSAVDTCSAARCEESGKPRLLLAHVFRRPAARPSDLVVMPNTPAPPSPETTVSRGVRKSRLKSTLEGDRLRFDANYRCKFQLVRVLNAASRSKNNRAYGLKSGAYVHACTWWILTRSGFPELTLRVY